MKAIINIQNKNNQYSKFNGLTFEVTDILSNWISLKGVNKEFPENSVDFSLNEIIIVDLQREMRIIDGDLAYCEKMETKLFGTLARTKFRKDTLERYMKINNIKID